MSAIKLQKNFKPIFPLTKNQKMIVEGLKQCETTAQEFTDLTNTVCVVINPLQIIELGGKYPPWFNNRVIVLKTKLRDWDAIRCYIKPTLVERINMLFGDKYEYWFTYQKPYPCKENRVLKGERK